MAKYPEGRRRTVSPKTKRRKHSAEDPSSYLLRALLDASPCYVSGSFLAEKLKISRVAVWGRIDKLRSRGLTIDAARNRGYRLAGEPDRLNRHLLEAWLAEKRISCPVRIHGELDSTNSEAERLLAAGVQTPFAVLADHQTQGRGRLGRTWSSPPAGNLYLTVAFRPEVPSMRLRLLTLWLGAALATELRSLTNAEIGLKWPNDLVVDGLKLGGMLTEATIDPERTLTLAFGLGLNVNAPTGRFPKSLRRSLSTLKAQTGSAHRIHELAATLIGIILRGYEECLAGLSSDDLRRAWEPLDCLAGKPITAQVGEKTLRGKAAGIDDSGALLLRKRNGSLQPLHSGEVTLNPKQ